MIDVKDRVPTYPGRMRLTREDGTFEYVILERADAPSEIGTPLNKVLFDSIAADINGKFSKLGGSINGNLTIQNTAPLVELFDPEADARSRVYKDATANNDYGTCIADIDKNGGTDMLNIRRSAALADKLSLYVGGTRHGIHGTHTKTWGSYTGTGVTTARQVNTGGIGYVCVVRGGGGTSIVLGSGAIRVSGGGYSWLPSGQVYFRNGILYLATVDSAFNTSGTSYTYEVL